MALRVTPVYAMNPPRLTRIITIVPIVTTAAFKSNPDKTRVTTNTAPKDIPKDVMVSAKKFEYIGSVLNRRGLWLGANSEECENAICNAEYAYGCFPIYHVTWIQQ